MSTWASTSFWSRETTAASVEGCDCSPATQADAKKIDFVSGDSGASDSLTFTKSELEELLDESIHNLAFTVTISARSEEDASLSVCAVSRGAEQTYEWPRGALLGDSGRIFDARAEDYDCKVAGKMMAAHLYGAEVSVVQTQRKSSGELFKAFQRHRGLSLGADPSTGEEVWYLVTVSFDITAEFERDRQGSGFVDYDFFEEAASSIAESVKSTITDAICARVDTQGGAPAQVGRELSCRTSASDESTELIDVTTPSWVVLPPESKKLFESFMPIEEKILSA